MLTNEEFYDRLAQFYDIMNDWPSRLAYEGPFIRQALDEHDASTVLDAACGTGHHTIALTEWGYKASGADSSVRMVYRARSHANAKCVNVSFFVAGLKDLPTLDGAPFDAVLCLGNSLPHVAGDRELDSILRGMSGALCAGGLLLLHNLNYDKRWVERPRFLKLDSGTLDGQEVLVWRMADYGETTLTFHTALFQKDQRGRWGVDVNSTPQLPLFRADLESRLVRHGFTNVRAYGNLKGDRFDPQTSGDLVLVATKSE